MRLRDRVVIVTGAGSATGRAIAVGYAAEGAADHDTLMLVDVVNIGWVPIYTLNLAGDVPGYVQAPATALSYPWKHYIGGHLGRLGTCEDVMLHQRYVGDAVTDIAAAPVVEKYTGVLGAADVFTASTTLWVLESVRLDDGVGIPVHC